ncbi:MAG: S9 family peptidase [Flavipsychrobacter sp.]|nr:S9 family peptidase [Flavipsychrobacter sp.]
MKYSLLIASLLVVQLANAQAKKQITMDDLFKNNTFRMKSVPGFNGMKDGRHYTKIEQSGDVQIIKKYNLETGAELEVLFDNSKTLFNGKQLKFDDYSFSKDEKKLMLKAESQNVYRRSVLNKVYVYDIATKSIASVDNDKVLHATFSPDGNAVAYVKGNNLYTINFANGENKQVTTDGEWNKIINGNCDWVYEEEFEFTRAFDWSPDGKYIAYYRFDETNVPQFNMAMYGGLYPKDYQYKYPKAGEPNSVIEIKVYDFASGNIIKADIGTETDQYIPRIKWTNDPKTLCIYRMNRLQNKLELLFANAATGKSEVIYTEENKSYIEINDNMEFLPDNSSFIFTSEVSGYSHLHLWDWKNKKLTDLTPGKYDIADITGVDKTKKLVYYTAAENSPAERKLYVINWDGKKRKTITAEDGVHSITPIEGYQYFLDKYSKINQPPVYYLRDADGKILKILEDNKGLKDVMADYNLGNIAIKQIDLSGGNTFWTWMITPPNFDPNKKYPVLMYQYSGPGSQEVADRFPIRDFFWHQMLAQKGYIVFCADGTGTGYRGEAFKKKTYLQLGKYESDDQIAIAKWLGSQTYVDKSRIGIWGWSYGGFMSSTCVFKSQDVFKMGIAVAPVSNWRYYDNIYTERYMRTPRENAEGYDNNAPEKMAGNLNAKYLLIHGTADDNVHFQNAVMLTDALIKANKEFDGEYYPNKNHGISGGITRYHLYKRMTDFILSNL